MLKQIKEFYGINANPIVGLEIGSSAVKILQLKKQGIHYIVDHYAIEPLKRGAVVEKVIKDKKEVIKTIERAILRANIDSDLVSICVPNSIAISRVIQLRNNLTEREIEQEIEIEMDKYVPYENHEVNTDFNIIGPSNNNKNLMDVLLVVSKTEDIDERVSLIESADLTVKIVDVESYAMERAFGLVARQLKGQGIGSLVALIDIGSDSTSFNVLDNQRVIYTREQPFGGIQLHDEIKHRYGLTDEEVISAKKYGDLPDDYYKEVLEPFKETVAEQVKHACQFFFSSGEYDNIDYICLTGGVGSLPGVDQIIQEKTEISTVRVNPFQDMKFNKHIDREAFLNESVGLMGCCGLAMRNFDK